MRLIAQINHYIHRHLTPAVRRIFFVNIGVFLAITIAREIFPPVEGEVDKVGRAVSIFAADPSRWYLVWQPFTYMFVHVAGGHLFLNMLALWFFAPELEIRWGTSRFWRFYFFVGVGAAALHALYASLPGGEGERVPVIGASGALFGVLLAFGAYYPYRTVYIWGVFPILMKYLIPLIILAEFYFLKGMRDGISHFTHLAGLVVAYLYLAKYHRTSDIRRWRYLR